MAIILDVGANTRRAERDIQKLVSRSYNINLKTRGDQPLGRITGQVNEFNKSLDASNARVIAFGASAGIIFGVQRAFGALFQSVVEVQKSLQDINVILNVSAQNLQKFGSELFNIAKNTGQSFQEVAKAATEFSRQGLGFEETLKRTNEALILSRLSGLDAAKSVEALTAAVNSFASQAVTATEVVNKFANVDAAFAVSSADLAEALARVGSSAAQSGVSLNELIAIVTSAQQTTARGGAVIGNSFKTIFTRLQRGKVVNLLSSLGISETDSSGQLKSTIQLLQDLGKVYDTLGARQQAAVAEQVGGVFQINILKAALADLGKEYSIYNSALNIAAGTTDQAIRRNEELNKTYAAQINALKENARELAAAGGERLLGPTINRLVGGTNEILGGINESDGENIGTVLGKGILDGLGQFIAGPGLALIGGVLLKLFRDLGKFATGSFQQLLGLNTAATQQRDLQTSIQQILSKNPKLLELALKGEQGLNTAANNLLASLQKQTVELQKQAQVAAQISKAFLGAGVRISSGVPVVPTGRPGKAAGYVPNFSAEVSTAVNKFNAPSNTKETSGIGTIGGKTFRANNKEIQIPKFMGTKDTAVIPTYGNGIKEATKMIANRESGSILDKNNRSKNKAPGFLPKTSKTKSEKDKKLPGLPVKSVTGESAKGLSTLYDQRNNFDKYIRPNIQKIPLEQTYEKYNFQAQGIVKKLRQRAERSSNPESEIQNLFNSIKFRNIPIKNYADKIVPSTLLNSSSDTPNINNIKGALGEIDNAKKFAGATKLPDIQGADFLVKETGGSYLVESKVRKKNTPDSVLIAKALRYEGTKQPKTKPFSGLPARGKTYADNEGQSIKLKDIILSYAEKESARKRKNFASGFIPNFAQTKEPSTQLGNLDKIPNKLGNKVLSLIYPGISEGYTLRPATASYLKKQYTGNIPVAGISQKKLQSQLPDIDKNIGNLLVKEANQFGQALGGFNFLKSPEELPNYGAAKGAVGVAFEGGVQTLLQQKVGKQNAGIDFRNITPRLRSVFNNAPGVYDAKRSPDLTNEVLQKLLNETKPGAIVQKSSGKAGAAYLKQRSAAVEQLRKEGVTGSVAIRQALKDRFGIVGKAAGYIPNFAAIQAPLQNAINNEIAAGASSNQIRVDKNSKLKTSLNPDGLAVWSKKYEGSLPEGIRMAEKAGINPKTKGMSKAGGFIPNFAIEDPDTQAAGLGTAIGAITAQLTGLAFAFAFSKDQVKTALNDLTASTKAAASAQRNQVAKDIKEKRRELQAQSLGGKVLTPAEQKEITIQNAKTLRQDETLAPKRAAATQAAKPGFGAKAGAFFDSNAFALAIAAPIIGETIKNLAGTETKTGRVAGAVGSGLGQAGSFAATGQLIGGKKGAGIGTVIGAFLSIPDVVEALVSDVPELTKAANLASQELTKFSEAGSRYFTAFEKLNTAITSEGENSKTVDAARKEYIQALSDLSVADQKSLIEAEKLGNAQEKYAELLEEKIAAERGAKAALEVGTTVAEQAKDQSFTKYFGFIGRTIGRTGKFLNENLGPLGSEEGVARNQALIDFWSPESAYDDVMSADSKRLQGAFLDLAVGAKSGADAITKIDEIQQNFKGSVGVDEAETPDDLRSVLQQVLGTETVGARDLTEQLVKDIEQNVLEPEDQKKAIQQIITTIRLGLAEAREKNVQAVGSEESGREEREKRIRVAKEEQAAINDTISEIQKNIAIQNLWRSSIDNLNENMRGFFNNLKIEQQLTQPRETLENIIGADKAPVRRLAAQEGLAGIQENQRAGVSGAAIGFKENVRGLLEKPFQENIDKLIADLKTTGGAFANRPEEDIRKESKEVQDKSKEQFGLLNQTMEQVEGYMAEFVSGQISTQQLLEQSRAALSSVGIDVSRGTQASNDIERAVAELEVKSVQEQIKAFQQRAKLASETKQAILQDKINQAFGVFGGFQGFMDRPNQEFDENYIDRITPDLDAARSIRSSGAFRYNVPRLSERARDEKAPDLGRAFAGIYRELIGQSGGAFRGFIQKEVDANRQLSGTSGGRISQTGGFDDIIRGRKVDIEQQLQLAKDQLKIETDPVLKRTLEGFIKSIEDLPGGTQGIATLQTMQEFGVARQSDYQELFQKYDVAAFDALSQISPELAEALSSAAAFTDDPLLNEASAQTAVQTEILKTIRQAMSESAGESGMVTPIDLEAYANEKDPAKRAAMKGQYLNNENPVDRQIQRAKEILKDTKDPELKRTLEGFIKATKEKSTTPLNNGNISDIFTKIVSGIKPLDSEAFYNEKDPDKRIKMLDDYENQLKTKKQELQQQLLPQDNRSIAEIEAETTAQRDRARSMGMDLESYRKEFPGTPTAVGPQSSPDYEKYQELNRPGQIFKSFDDVLKNWAQRESFQRTGTIPDFEMKTDKPVTQAVKQESFTQQEAAFNNNTSALTSLAGGIESLNATLTNFEANFGNLNNVPGAQPVGAQGQANTQPGATTTTNAPVSVIVNAQGSNDIAAAVGEEIEKSIPTIINKVRASLGPPFNKIPPQAPKP